MALEFGAMTDEPRKHDPHATTGDGGGLGLDGGEANDPRKHGNGSTSTPRADPAEVRRFLEAYTLLAKAATKGMANPGLLQMGRVHPLDKKKGKNGKDKDDYVPLRYMIDDVDLMIADAIAASNAGHNVYIEGRTVRAGLRGKQRGAVKDTVAVFALVADDDGDKGKAAKALPIKPTLLVESSLGNSHPWFFLNKAVPPNEGVVLGAALKAALGGDPNTGTITQPYRVSGTVNYPTRNKLERGRVTVPTRLIAMERAYTIEEFNVAFPPPVAETPQQQTPGAASGAPLELPPDLLILISDTTQGGRGPKFYSAVKWLKRLNHAPADIVAVMEMHPNGIAAKYAGRLATEVERAFNKPDDATETTYPLALELAVKMWGEPTHKGRFNSQWGEGDTKKILNNIRGDWFDFENNVGGGVRDLIRMATAAAAQEAKRNVTPEDASPLSTSDAKPKWVPLHHLYARA
jgi:RepB DNA-primase from phage plasmid